MGNQFGSLQDWVIRVRKDPLGASGWDSLLQLYRFAEAYNFQSEHILDDNLGTHYGEHNAANVPRDVGDVHSGAVQAAKYAAVGSHPATGEFDLTFSGFTFTTLWDFPFLSVQATSMSENGATKPAIVGSQIVGNNDIRFYCHYLTSALGAGNTWAAEDADFAFAIHGTPRPAGLSLQPASLKSRGDTLDFNAVDALAEAEAELWANFGSGHSQSSSKHTATVIPKAYCQLGFISTGTPHYTNLVQDPNNNTGTITRVGTGHVQVHFANAWTLPLQPFFGIDYPRTSGGTPAHPYVIVAPYSLQTTSMVELYIYKYDGTNWVRDDTDFWLSVHAS